MSRIVKIGLVIFCVLAISGWGMWRYISVSYNGEPAWVYIPAGSDHEQESDSLKSALGEKFGLKTALLWRLMKGEAEIAHGAYKVTSGDRAMTLARRLKNGAQTPVKVTFNNVRTIGQLAGKVTARLEMMPDEFIAAADSLTKANGFKHDEMSAAFLPDTYEFYWTASPVTVVGRLLDYRNRFWSDERRAKARKLGLTPVQVAIVASIAEEETNSAAERPVVARLYMNRIHRGMPLQADPTVKWAVGDFSLRRITRAHLAVESPYNTYKHAGLPPGPIRIPAAATLDAVLDAPEHDYLYMCASDDFSGRHKFTATFAEHQKNAMRYRAALNRRNIH